MKTSTECAVCAWRGECKKKFSYESSGLYCPDYTRDAAFPPADGIKPPADGGERKKPDKAV